MTRPEPTAGSARGADHTATVPPEARGFLTIDLSALCDNYRLLRSMAEGAVCAAVIKADAYGTGASPAARALAATGCDTFFVATLREARVVRATVAEATIYVLDGLFPHASPSFLETGARPVLGSVSQIREWAGLCRREARRLPAAIHIDTGMNRLGLPPGDVDAVAADADELAAFELALVMSHLACADEPDHPKNEAQRLAFDELRAKLPPAPASLANSAGVMLGPRYHHDVVRPGIALYGGRARVEGPNPMKHVVQLEGRIAQVRTAPAGETVGYGATRTFDRPTRVATVTLGYADGLFRLLGSSDAHDGAVAYVGEHPAPLLGRVSMDLITIDVSNVPDDLVRRGVFVELLGPHVTVDDLAAQAQTIGYEVLTSLGHRCERVYSGRPVPDG